MKNSQVWFITPKTNLHVGNENTTSYDLIDKAVQRDVLTELPCINSSSLKGALNEYVSSQLRGSDKDKLESADSEKLIKIFGCDKTDSNKPTQKGSYTFFDANILFLPEQNHEKLYELVTCQKVISMFITKMSMFGVLFTETDLKNIFKYRPVDNCVFEKLCNNYNLPIIARNKVGEKNNLWYEQVVPSETVFYTFINCQSDTDLELIINNKIVQIGANATIGYGYCEFTKLKTK